MIEYVLPSIKDTNDYITALSLFKADAPLTSEEAGELAKIYQKYGHEVDNRAKAKMCIALDLLPGRTEDNAADFAELGLADADITALFLFKSILSSKLELTDETARRMVDTVQSRELTQPLNIILARVALDIITGSWNFGGLREQARVLAEFLASVGAAELDKCSVLVSEVKRKCGR